MPSGRLALSGRQSAVGGLPNLYQLLLLVDAGYSSSTPLLVASLYLLGLGWNFGFVAASALLTEDAPPETRVSLQGVADAIVWTSAAMVSLSSGALLEAGSYSLLALIGASLVVIPVAFLLRYRTAFVVVTA